MYCSHCGKELTDGAYLCPNCGALTQNNVPSNRAEKDSGSPVLILLGLFFPVIGLILLLIWKTALPKSAKSVGIGAWIGLVIQVILIALYLVFIIGIIRDAYQTAMLFASAISMA